MPILQKGRSGTHGRGTPRHGLFVLAHRAHVDAGAWAIGLGALKMSAIIRTISDVA